MVVLYLFTFLVSVACIYHFVEVTGQKTSQRLGLSPFCPRTDIYGVQGQVLWYRCRCDSGNCIVNIRSFSEKRGAKQSELSD